jgi:hypothetical protein
VGEVGASRSVVADFEDQDIGGDLDLDADGRGAGVLGGVRQRLGDDVVRADLDRLRQPLLHTDLEVDRDRRPAGERLQRRGQTTLGQDRRVDAAGDLAQVVQCPGCLGDGVVESAVGHLGQRQVRRPALRQPGRR